MNNVDNNLSFGQRIDPENGLVECWFTHGSLDFIKTLKLEDKDCLMYGAGLGDRWLARRCKKLVVIERNDNWLMKCSSIAQANNATNLEYIYRPCDDCIGLDSYYTAIPEGYLPDVIIVDDAYRYECIINAIKYSKESKKDILLVVDNYQQDFVFICPAAEEALKDYYKLIFPQHDHTDHNGNKWQTAIFNLAHI